MRESWMIVARFFAIWGIPLIAFFRVLIHFVMDGLRSFWGFIHDRNNKTDK
jgi:hypothetical protein